MQLPANPNTDRVYLDRVRPLMFTCSAVLMTAYLVGLLFTLRTHVKQIYYDVRKHDSTLLGFVVPAAVAQLSAH